MLTDDGAPSHDPIFGSAEASEESRNGLSSLRGKPLALPALKALCTSASSSCSASSATDSTHKRGTFVYRLAGRDRQKSASYYTPESLTRTVVKHALRELVTDATPADDILNVTVCEPAMGSAAFLNEDYRASPS